MWPTIVSVWFTVSSILNWMYQIYLHLVDKCKVVFVGRRNDGVVADQASLEEADTKSSSSREITQVAAIGNSRQPYNVFVNHRGPDVKLTFAAHLNDALCRAGFYPFLDTKSIREGSNVFKSIDEGLGGATVHVAIFSKRYAESQYCLEELCAMLRSQKVIIPVFYDVKPENLRNTDTGPYAEAFSKHQHRRGRDKDQIQKWKDALLQVAEFRGFLKDEVNG